MAETGGAVRVDPNDPEAPRHLQASEPESPDNVFANDTRLRAQVLGCRIDRVDLEQAVGLCEEAIRVGRFTQHMSINVAKLVAMRTDDELRRGIERCELVTADGQPVVWASRLLGDPLPMRVAGIDLMEALLARAVVRGYRVYILGARPEILLRAVARLHASYPGILLVGYRDGFYAEEEEAAVAATIADARPDILFVAMSSPRKEYFLMRHGPTLGVPFVMGVGGAIDVVAGVTRRAPVVLRRSGLEWLFRCAQEPRRLTRRYLATNTRFIALMSRELGHDYVTRRLARRESTRITSTAGGFSRPSGRRSTGRATR
jgi:N-acetylglucosaminyldiphosphoundecaprenol N-acetyl-beta-D-mannosaminyltransferase